jgi:hypothetical protein
MEVAAGVEVALAAPTVAGGFRTGAPAANALAGIASIPAIVVTARKSRRHIKASHVASWRTIMTTIGSFNHDDAEKDFRPYSGVTPLPTPVL